MPVHYTAYSQDPATQPVDFSPAAETSVKAVVHVTTLTQGKTVVARDPYDPFGIFGRQYRIPNQRGSGSGVLISADGYIVTNNHVVEGTDKVQVTFNNRNTQMATVVGTDPATDLAVLKIEGDNFPFLHLGNSDQVKLGQWVLAVGYPLNLDATVTAGIVSAKGRSIGINRMNNPNALESFIQTDAAVNQGNSGGALVNTHAELIGINAAIASPTGSYAGYSYAIPSNIVKKVAEDLIQFGQVKRGYLGIELLDLNKISERVAAELGVSKEAYRNMDGVYVADVIPGSGADKAGMQKGDFITSVNGSQMHSVPQLMEHVSRHHPGDKIDIVFERDGKVKKADVTLMAEPQPAVAASETASGPAGKSGRDGALLGATMRDLTKAEAQKMRISGGAMITDLNDGILKRNTSIRPGFVIQSLNDQKINSVQELREVLRRTDGDQLEIAGSYPGKNAMYYYGLRMR